MLYTPISEERKPEFINWLTNMSKDLEELPEQPPVNNIFPGSKDGDVITIKDMVGNFIATLTGQNFIMPVLLFLVMLFSSCSTQPQYATQPFYNDQGQQVMYVDRGDGTSFLMDYMLYSTLFRQGGYNSINNYYTNHPSEFSNNRARYSNYYPKTSNGVLNKTVSASSYTSPSRSYSSPSRSSNSYSSPNRSYSSPSRSYSSPSRSYSSPSRSYSSPGRR